MNAGVNDPGIFSWESSAGCPDGWPSGASEYIAEL
jgi:hypothetical protein